MSQETGQPVFQNQVQNKRRALFGWLNTIRSRLTVILILFSIIPIILTASIVSPVGLQNARQRLYGTLQAIATLKQNLVVEWVNNLHANLSGIIEKDAGLRRLPTLLRTSPDADAFRPVYIAQLVELQSEIQARGIFDEIYLADLLGNVVLATETGREALNIFDEQYFIRGLQGQYIQPPYYDPEQSTLIVIAAQPVISTLGDPIGVLIGRARVDSLTSLLLDRTGLGQTGETYLVGTDYTILTLPRFSGYQPGETLVESEAAVQAIRNSNDGTGEYRNYQNIQVFGAYLWIPEINAALLVEQHRSEALVFLRAINTALFGSALAAMVLAIVAALFIGRNLTRPLTELTDAADDIRAGSFETHEQIQRLSAERQDEIGSLASAFNAMILQLRNLIDSLEQRVSDRTKDLQNRSEQLQAAAEVSRSSTTILDLKQLMQQVVDLIQHRFDLYYVGLFLADEPVLERTPLSDLHRPIWAVLQSGTGEAGKAMIARGHRLQIGGGSMIGWSIANARARIALEAGEDPERLATPDLPNTRSEAAIPLRSRGQVLGALTIQSSEPDAFDTETIAVFQTMADQIGVAVDNARLFAETEEALQTSRSAFGQLTEQAWMKRLGKQPISYSIGSGAQTGWQEKAASEALVHESAASLKPNGGTASPGSDFRLPIKIRDKVIGYVNASKTHPTQPGGARPSSSQAGNTDGKGKMGKQWRQDDITLLSNMIDQLGVALDSARLFEETQERAERERLVGDLTSRMRASLDIDTVLQTAAQEIRRALNLEEVEVRLGTEEQE